MLGQGRYQAVGGVAAPQARQQALTVLYHCKGKKTGHGSVAELAHLWQLRLDATNNFFFTI